MVLPRLGPAGGCWLGKKHPERLPEAFWGCKVRSRSRNQKSEFLQLLGCCCSDSQNAERLKSPKMKRKLPDGSFYLFQSIWLNQKSPDAEIPSPEVTQVAGPAVTDNATPKMEQKSKSFESSLTCAGDAEILSPKMNQKSPDAEIPSPKMEQKSKSFEPSLTPTAPPAPSAEAAPTVAPQSTTPPEQRTYVLQNGNLATTINGQIGPWDPGIQLAEEPDHKSTIPSGTSGLQVQSLTCRTLSVFRKSDQFLVFD